MTTTQILFGALAEPQRALPAAVERRSALLPILAATVASLALAATVATRADVEGAVLQRLSSGPQADQISPHDLAEKVEQGRKLAVASGYAVALGGPAATAALAALGLALGFRLAGARPSLRASFSAASWGLLPGGLRALLTIPAVIRLAPVRPDDVPRLLPSSLAALLPTGAAASGPLGLAAAALDLFSLWAVVIAGLGMAEAAQVPRRRAIALTAVLFVASVAVFRVALPTLLAGAPK
jgi:hypothetical protein